MAKAPTNKELAESILKRIEFEGKTLFEWVKLASKGDFVEVVRCRDCKFAMELNKHCEINRTAYRHCTLLRGDETRNVWHKYLKCYTDYSIVELDGYCSEGERRSENES